MKHKHNYVLGQSKTIYICKCGSFKHAKNITPIVAIETPEQWLEMRIIDALQDTGLDAAFIVRAVNCHQELLSVAKMAFQIVDRIDAKAPGFTSSFSIELKQAIAEAEGK